MLLIKSMGTEEKEAVAGEARMKASYQAEVTDLWVCGLGAADQRHRQRAAKRGDHPGGPRLLQHRRTGPDPVDRLLWVCNPAHKHLSNYCSSWSNFKGAQGSVDRVSQIMDEREEPLDEGCAAEVLGGTSRCGTCASPTGTQRCLPVSTRRSPPEKLPRSWALPAAARQRC